jgi:hypothetical protein
MKATVAELKWAVFQEIEPGLAGSGKDLFYQFGVGLGFLATVRRDGGPRVHPICPIITADGLYAFLIPSPKRDDLLRDPRYALHSFPAEKNDDAFYMTGIAEAVEDRGVVEEVRTAMLRERNMERASPEAAEEMLFEFLMGRCLLTRTQGHGDYHPVQTVWPKRS